MYSTLTAMQLSGYRSHYIFHFEWRTTPRRHSFRQPFSNRLGLRHRHRLCYHHLCYYIRWSLQPSYYDMLRSMARLSLEKSSLLYILANLRLFYGWNAAYGDVLARDPSIQGRDTGKGWTFGCEWCTCEHPVHIPKPNPDV